MFAVRFANFFQFALDLAGDAAGRYVADVIFYERLLLRWLETQGERPFAGADVRTYDLAGALHAAIRDMKDAAVPCDPELLVDALRIATRDPASRLSALDLRKFGALLAAYRYYESDLRRLGVSDRSDVFRAAAGRAQHAAGPLFVYGFYDMTQVQADLVTELARAIPVTLLVPHGADEEVWRFGAWFRSALPMDAPQVLPSPAPPPAPELHSAVGERDEAWFCAKRVRKLLDGGCAPEEIAVVARTLDPYLAPLAALFDEHRIPGDAPPWRALLDHPLAHAILGLFRAMLDELPRAQSLDVVCHPLFRGPADRRHWALLARSLRIARGDDWSRLDAYCAGGYRIRVGRETDDDRREIRIPAPAVRALRTAVRRLRQALPIGDAGWARHAAAHREALERCFRLDALLDDETRIVEAMRDVLATLARLDELGETVPREVFVETFERECRRRRLGPAVPRGVAVLDAMAARGLPFRHVFLLGLNARVFPRFIVEEPFISDAVRREVFRVLGHHLPVRLDAYDEERLLFHLMRTAPAEGLVCLYQRADADGRLRDPSPFLRPFLPLERDGIDAIPRSERAKQSRGEVATPRELLRAAPDASLALAAFGFDALAYDRARAFLAALDGERAVSAFEGRVGPLARHWTARSIGHLSATRLERFATCPFRYFAEEVLRILPADDVLEGEDLDPREIGRLMHALLERLYGRLGARGFRLDDLAPELARAAAAVAEEFEGQTHVPLRGVLRARFAEIVRAVEAFAAFDLATLGDWEPLWFEEGATVSFGGLVLSGKLDRIDRQRGTGALRVVDYKRRFRESWQTALATQARRAGKLQGPLYLEIAAAVAASHGTAGAAATQAIFQFVEDYLRGDPAVDEIREERLVRVFTAEEWAACRDDVERAVTTFASLIRDGWFFIRVEDGQGGHCSHCDFAWVCRKNYGRLRRKPEADCTPVLAPYWEIVAP
ncbi:MAG: hypothetical protein E6J75_05420 [Deltaproteobacteria bacterium]|nr:MAG: hypothetical protein E6J75_05420 [Deltaproteobacteria bacterium]